MKNFIEYCWADGWVLLFGIVLSIGYLIFNTLLGIRGVYFF